MVAVVMMIIIVDVVMMITMIRDLHVGGLRHGGSSPVSPVSTQLRELPHSQLGVSYHGGGVGGDGDDGDDGGG